MKDNPVLWFEIPVLIMERAIKFYESVFRVSLSRNTLNYPTGKVEMAWFPMQEDKVGAGGALIDQSSWAKPGNDGVLVYLSSLTNDLNDELSRVDREGGKVLTPKTFISKAIGYIGTFLDTEGNKVALLSRK